MQPSRVRIILSVTAAILMAAASFAGAFLPGTYGQETVNWAAQGRGQDIVNLFLASPAILASAYLAHKGSIRAFLVWIGLLLYVTYSYAVYALYLHFGPWFPAYVATLGTAFYALVGSLAVSEWKRVEDALEAVRGASASAFLMAVCIAFSVSWSMDVYLSLYSGTLPRGLTETGLWVNPVHVLDLAIFLPATGIVAWQLKKRLPFGLFMAVPFLVFLVVMGTAILSMGISTARAGFPFSAGVSVVMAGAVLAGAYLAYRFLGEMRIGRSSS